MKKLLLSGLLGVLLASAISGCASPGSSTALTAGDLSVFTYPAAPLKYDDPKTLFSAVFPSGFARIKDPLDTQAEHEAKLAALGYQGAEMTLLIPPEACEIIPFPEQSFYIIVSKDDYYPNGFSQKPYSITLATERESPRSFVGQNTYGAKTEVTSYRLTSFKIAPTNLFSIPKALRWDRNGFVHFGVPIKIVSDKYRSLLRENKLGLAVKVKVGELAKAANEVVESKATIRNPVEVSGLDCILPVTVLAAWLVDTTTDTGLVQWAADRPTPQK